MKKPIALLLAMIISLAGCGGSAPPASTPGAAAPASEAAAPADAGSKVTKDNIKIGMVCITDPSDQGYTYNHDQGAKKMIANLGLKDSQYIPKFNINDTDVAATNAAINELISAGCQIIFANSFSYGSAMAEAAKEHPDIQFCHATGSDAHFNNLSNLHNYFAKIHEGRYLGGIAAGMKTKANKLGYVAAYPYAEVISGFTAFFLGAKSVNPNVTMDVIYINSWGDTQKEREVAEALINRGCDVISQHSDNVSPALAAQDKGVWHVGYNNDMAPAAPKASLISARIDWSIYMTMAVQDLLDGKPIPVDWGGGLSTGAVYMSPLNKDIAAPGTQEAIDKAVGEIKGGMMIFKGALVDNDGKPAVITDFNGKPIFTFTDENSFFDESSDFSAPSFNAVIKGINIIS